jgi:peptidoglycan/LPS O-acetylase OafA/YrhL
MLPPSSLSSPRYIPAIDGLRAVAVLAVIIFHLDFLDLLPGGFTGVDMFFVISGYVISHSLHGRVNLGFGPYLLNFYQRRLLRLLPALLLMLWITFVLSALLIPPVWLSSQNDQTGLAAFFGLSNFVLAANSNPYFSPGAELNPFLHTWSLGVEEQFYLIFPAIYFFYVTCRKSRPWVRAVLPMLALASFVVSVMQSRAEPLAAFYLLPSRFWELAAGALLFQVLQGKRGPVRPAWLAQGLLLAGLALIVATFLFAERQAFPFPWALATVGGTLMVLTAVVSKPLESHSVLHRLLGAPPVAYLGRLSYSLYLWHWPVLALLRWTTGTELLAVQLGYPVVVLALAAASYHWVETPLRRGKVLGQRSAWATLATAAGTTGLLWWAASWVADNNERLSLSQVSDTYIWHAYKHYPREPLQRIEDPHLNGRQLFVLGDSHTAAYRTMLNIVALKLGVTVFEHERGGCGVARLIAEDPADCAEWRDAALAQIEARAKPGDIVFLASLRMPELARRDWRGGEAAAWAQAQLSPANIAQGRRSAENMLIRLQAMGVTVLIDAPKPLFKAPANRCSDVFNRMNPVCAAGLTMGREQLETLRAPQLALLRTLQTDYRHLVVWDPFALLCPGAICSVYDDNGWPLYADADHLSGHGNRVLAEDFIETLVWIWKAPARP